MNYAKLVSPALLASVLIVCIAWRAPTELPKWAGMIFAWYSALMTKSILPETQTVTATTSASGDAVTAKVQS